jgi:hypothetical protein
MPRFVLLNHECPPGYIKPSHYDFMLEFDGVLWTWELRQFPEAWRGKAAPPNEVLSATRLADHRLTYLDYEGPLSGNRGSVRQLATGTFTLLAADAERIAVRLDSKMYRGEIQLTATSQHGHWLLSISS